MAIPTTCSKIILVVLNLIFVAAGALLIYIGTAFKGSQWTEVLSTAVPSTVDKIGLYIIIFGCLVCVIACFGFFGALCRSRGLLTVYSFFVFVAFAIFTAGAVVAFISASTASKWNSNAFPADDKETSVATGLNQVYCYTQGARLCTTASASEAFAAFVPDQATTIVAAAKLLQIDVEAKTGVNGFCSQVDKQITALGAAGALAAQQLPSAYKQACTTCADVQTKYGQYKSIFEWTEKKCALTTTTALYCGKFLLTSKQPSDVYKDAPYEQCRPALLDLWRSYSTQIAVGCTVTAVVALFLIFIACEAGKRFDYSQV
ncbi:unnamed protein product [Aphanomyces euteiches]|uniref:Tetraspanin n=1 Tax=Aphanomyces euteiches TaxID=100861 RepID=A0A6G0XW51_9STRA|nr:hypothetical protein Ae201684_001135 [Aphanomyces euteiches]KAH9099695.1 hypothetical protein Ae201684P_018708 [Aphanomyces euteiches]KAH9144933.1 hypothetical protein AeRB84_011152 [Aphanomyces euteiches]